MRLAPGAKPLRPAFELKVTKNAHAPRDISEHKRSRATSAARQISRSGGSRGPGRSYFFLAEPLLLELDLLELELLFEPELFDPPDLDADLAINALLNSGHNRSG